MKPNNKVPFIAMIVMNDESDYTKGFEINIESLPCENRAENVARNIMFNQVLSAELKMYDKRNVTIANSIFENSDKLVAMICRIFKLDVLIRKPCAND